MHPHEILQALYDSEINCRIECFWDGGWTGWLGDETNGFRLTEVRGLTFVECVANLANQACAVYPESVFAERYRPVQTS
jgi:hypothetical protein